MSLISLRIATLFVSTFALVFATPATAAPPHFSSVLDRAPEKIWAPGLDPRVSDSVRAFIQKKKLAGGEIYGGSIRNLDLSKLCSDEIEREAKMRGCTTKKDLVRIAPGKPRAGEPKLDSRGRTIPLVSYLCPDGGVIRMKPRGDPTDPRELAPSAVKAMRFFGSEDYRNFSDEAFKVDNDGRPIPKWAKDLNFALAGLSSPRERERYVSQWARDAHTELRSCH